MKKIYISGAGGMLGAAVVPFFKSKRWQVYATDIRGTDGFWEYNDVRNYHTQHASIFEFLPDVILDLAAETDLEFCEGHGNDALTTNAGGSATLAALAQKFDATYFYISTGRHLRW